MDLILSVRQMMAEAKFSDAQSIIWAQLSIVGSNNRSEWLVLYLESVEKQGQPLPLELTLEFINLIFDTDHETAHFWFKKLDPANKFHRDYFLVKIRFTEKQGRISDLYQLISHFQFTLFERKTPAIPELVTVIIHKYFKTDFHLRLQKLALEIILGDTLAIERLVKELIFLSLEKSAPKDVRAKMRSLLEVLNTIDDKSHLELYRNYCALMLDGIKTQKDYKKLSELIIYFDEFKMQVLILDLVDRLSFSDLSHDYSKEIKKNRDYDFVYLDKYFGHLKRFFVTKNSGVESIKTEKIEIDLTLDSKKKVVEILPARINDELEGESLLLHILKYQNYDSIELNEISVSFLQSNLPKVALKATELSIVKSEDTKTYLKASYLKLTCLLMIGDYRGALDVCLESLGKAESKDDILSFMYGQAEAYIKLNQLKNARSVLKRIISIDENYRMAKERLEKLDEI